jgi:hypothetical protein
MSRYKRLQCDFASGLSTRGDAAAPEVNSKRNPKVFQSESKLAASRIFSGTAFRASSKKTQ